MRANLTSVALPGPLPGPLLSLLLSLLVAGVLPAQEPAVTAAERLEKLLQELAATDSRVWQSRLEKLEQQAKAHDQQAADLRTQAQKLQQQATDADAAAKAVRTEIERLKELQKLLSGSKPAATPTPAPSPPPKTEPRPTRPKSDGKQAAATTATAPDHTLAAADALPRDLVTWADIQPILGEHCTSCHDADEKKGGLDATAFATMRQGGGSGRTLVPGEPEQSRLYLLIARKEQPFMPRNADALPAEVVLKLRTWIEHGASEDAAGARSFLKQRAAAARASAAEAAADTAAPAPLPEHLPPVAVRMPARPAPVRSLRRSPRAALLAMPGQQQVLLFDGDWQPLGVLDCPLPRVDGVTFAADGTLLLAAGGAPGKSGEAIVYDVRTGKQLARCGNEHDVPLAAAVHAGSGLLALGGSGKAVTVHTLSDGSVSFTARHDDFVLALDFSPDGSLLAAADRSGALLVWETDGGRLGQTLSGHKGAVNGVAFHRAGRQLASAGADGTLRLWDVIDGKELWQKPAHLGPVFAVAFGPDDRIATAGQDGKVRTWDRQGKSLATSPAAGDWLYDVAFGSSSELVFAGDWQGRVHRFDGKAKELTVVSPLQPAQ